ncbi:receptor-like tyrosine-protein kinase kin-15 [Artemisia annua]|uniref:Receptor-like tyrosine-protein kinase kin-15 n=1 Tax=Artemisia annua TaxID=35608 RepID=A0A2U1PEL3_ARTAN|nr:receptor-like tyrosine-protein kinase kin-15 [Artemisia annua]
MSSPIQDLDYLIIPLKDILKATNHFSNKNFIRQGGFGKIYKGKLLRSGELIDIVARRLDGKYDQGSKEFWTEVSMLSRLKHTNLVSLVGFCDEKNEKIVINKYEAKGSLDHYVTDPTLRWTKRLEICVKISHALSYIHYDVGRDFSVIHRNIKNSKILLDDNYEPKLAGFELSMTTVASQRGRLCIDYPCGSTGYVDPTYANTGSVTHKSDMYSFGIVLFEVLFGTKAITDNRDIKLAKEAKSRYENEQLEDLINPYLRTQMAGESLKIFSDIAYDCLKECRVERPSIRTVVMKLEKALEIQRLQEKKALKEEIAATREKLDKNEKTPFIIYPESRSKSKIFQMLNQRSGKADYRHVLQEKINQLQGGNPILDIRAFERAFSDWKKASCFELSMTTLASQRGRYVSIILVVALYDQGSKEFWTEVSMLSRLKHTNLVSLVGFCDEKNEKIVINKYEAKGSLDHYVTDPTLRWTKRLEICVKISHALSYIHYDVGRDFSVIHRNIKNSKILLDDNYEPKLAGFELSMTTVASQRGRLCIDYPCGSTGYVDPTYANTGSVTHKSDMYSFGIVLFEVLFGTKAITDNRDIKLAKEAKSRYENEQLEDLINPYLRTQMAGESLKIFSDIAYDCLKECRVERPSIRTVVMKLEKALEIQRLQEKKALKEEIAATREKLDKNEKTPFIIYPESRSKSKIFQMLNQRSGKADYRHVLQEKINQLQGGNPVRLFFRY